MVSFVKNFLFTDKQMISNLTIHPLTYDPSFTRFTRDAPLSSIVREMFIERWNPSFSFEQYYKRCAPSVCKYTTTARRQDFFGVMLILISMIGGLAIALRIATPILVNTVLDYLKPKPRRTSQRPPLFVRAKNMTKMVSKAVFNLNIFPSGAFGNGIDRDTAKHLGRWSTRVYVALLAMAVTILTLRTLVSPETITKTLEKPSFDAYTDLTTHHRDTLQCPCSVASSPYSQFLQIEGRFHQVSRQHYFEILQKGKQSLFDRSVRVLSSLIDTD